MNDTLFRLEPLLAHSFCYKSQLDSNENGINAYSRVSS